MASTYAVLIIGDLPDISEALDGLPCDVTNFVELEPALDLIAAGKANLVLCDYPDLEPIRQMHPDIPVIVLAQEAPRENVLIAIEKAYAYFSPPFPQDHIREMISEALHNPDVPDSIQIESRDPNFTTLRLRCRFSTADRLIRFAMQMKSDIPAEDRRQAAMAFREMLLNAIEHGGRLDPNKWVRVSRVRTQRTLVYYIQDPGQGFSRDSLIHAAVSNPDNAPDEHMKYRQQLGMRSGGFGMLLTQHLVDEVIYNERGNEVVLIKHLV